MHEPASERTTDPPRRLPAGGRRAKREGSEHRADSAPDTDQPRGATQRGRRAAYPPGWGATGAPAGTTGSASTGQTPGNYRGRRAAYPPAEEEPVTEGGAVSDDAAADTSAADFPTTDSPAADAPATEETAVPDWTTEHGTTEPDWLRWDQQGTGSGSSGGVGTAPGTATSGWQDPLTADPLTPITAPVPSEDSAQPWWAAHSPDPGTDSEEIEDPLGLTPEWARQPGTGQTGPLDPPTRSEPAQDPEATAFYDALADDAPTGGAPNERSSSHQLATGQPAGIDAWAAATGASAAGSAVEPDPVTGEATISSAWERDFTQTTTMWGRLDTESPAEPVPGAAGFDLSETGIADHTTTSVPGVSPTDPGLATADSSVAFEDAEPAMLDPDGGPQPPWMRFERADEPSATEASSTSALDSPPVPERAAPAERSATTSANDPAATAPPPADPLAPRSRRPLWRDEVEPDRPATAPASAPAARRSATPAGTDTRERRRQSGLPGWAAIVIGLGITVGAGVFDLFWTGELGILFSVCFGLIAFSVAASIRRSDIFTAAVLPPLELLATLVTLGLIAPERLYPSATNHLEAILSALAASWITLVAAVLITFGVLVIRWAIGPRSEE